VSAAITAVPVDDRVKPGHDDWREIANTSVMAGLVPAIHARPVSIKVEIDPKLIAAG
jgi:hypothetical protein